MIKQWVRRAGAVVSLLFLLASVFPTGSTVLADTDWKKEGYTAISTPYELNNLIRKKLDGKFYLTDDIVFKPEDFQANGTYYNDGALWIPLGPTYSERFSGILDGNGHTISGLKVAMNSGQDSSAYAGLFGYSSGTIRNLRLLNCDITVKNGDYSYAGAIAGAASGTISGCYVLGGSVKISNAGTVACAGGVVGRMYSGNVRECYNGATVSAKGTMATAGGIVANNHAKMEIVNNQGNITANSSNGTAYAGGVIGVNDGTLANSLNRGAVSVTAGADGYGGGIIGCHRTGTNSLAVNLGAVSMSVRSHSYGGAIAGQVVGGTLKSCYYLESTFHVAVTDSKEKATSLTAKQLSSKSSFPDLNFTDTWVMSQNLPALKRLEGARSVITSIKITKRPTKIAYNEGETFDPAGMVVTANYEDGKTKAIPAGEYLVTGFNSQSPGQKDLTVSYNGYTDKLTVTVRKKVLQSISIDKEHLPRVLYGVGETFDVTGGVVLAKFDNGATIRYSLTNDMVGKFDSSKIGKTTVTITFGGKKTTLEVTIQKNRPPVTTTTTDKHTVVSGTAPQGGSNDTAIDSFDTPGNNPSAGGHLIAETTTTTKKTSSTADNGMPLVIWIAIVVAVLIIIAAGAIGLSMMTKNMPGKHGSDPIMSIPNEPANTTIEEEIATDTPIESDTQE